MLWSAPRFARPDYVRVHNVRMVVHPFTVDVMVDVMPAHVAHENQLGRWLLFHPFVECCAADGPVIQQ